VHSLCVYGTLSVWCVQSVLLYCVQSMYSVCVARLYSLYSVTGSVCILFIQLTQCVCSMCLQCTEFVESDVCVYSLSEKSAVCQCVCVSGCS